MRQEKSSTLRRNDLDQSKEAFDIIESWKITNQEKQSLLKRLRADKEAISEEKQESLLMIIEIDTELRRIFSNPENAEGFLGYQNNNAPFFGARPIEVLLTDKDINQALSKLCSAVRHISSPYRV